MLHYNVDFYKLFKLFTIIMLRATTLLIELLKSCSAGLTNMHIEFLSFRTETLNRMQYSSQVCYLRKLLNDFYDATLRRIAIFDSVQRAYTIMYRTNEERPLMMSTTDHTLINRRDTILQIDEFLVIVPVELESEENKIKTLLNQSKLVTKQYQIRYENI